MRHFTEYLPEYTDLQFKADVFLYYGNHAGELNERDLFVDQECIRRFGKSLRFLYDEIYDYIGFEDCAKMIFMNLIKTEDELIYYKKYHNLKGGVNYGECTGYTD